MELNSNHRIAGVDEAGRGPLAGPVVAAAVVLDHRNPIAGIKDSKTISQRQREIVSRKIREGALDWAIGSATPREIDELNIHNAVLLAMRRAILGLRDSVNYVYIDGKFSPEISVPTETVVGGDKKILAVSAASILAKVFRDSQMCWLDALYPGYGFKEHKGYPTAYHRIALSELGPTPEHRMSYSGVTNMDSQPVQINKRSTKQ